MALETIARDPETGELVPPSWQGGYRMICQVFNGTPAKWQDLATIKTEEDLKDAIFICNRGEFSGIKGSFRIVDTYLPRETYQQGWDQVVWVDPETYERCVEMEWVDGDAENGPRR